MEKLTGADSREALDLFIEYNLKMMVFSGALADAYMMDHRWWCIQFENADPATIPHECASMLAHGFHLGVKHYHDYRVEQRELAVCLAEVDAEEAAK